ncbi:MAG TPA: DUF3788 family protein [bacterium]|nr:DUF3788 family protein [bacterium]
MANSYFTDPKSPPTEESVQAALGRVAGTWRALFAKLRAQHPDLTESWNYYNDGKSWLLKVTQKKKTMFWLIVEKGAFRITFYFATRLTDALLTSEISAERKTAIQESAVQGKLKGVSVKFGPRSGIQDVLKLVDLKKTLK